MSKRKIESALRRKGLSCSTLEYNLSACPGGMIGGWEIALDEMSENLVVTVDPDFDDLTPDCANADEVLEWIDTLPDVMGGIDFKAALKRERYHVDQVHRFSNGLVIVFDREGNQMPCFQGPATEVLPLLVACGWNGDVHWSELKTSESEDL